MLSQFTLPMQSVSINSLSFRLVSGGHPLIKGVGRRAEGKAWAGGGMGGGGHAEEGG